MPVVQQFGVARLGCNLVLLAGLSACAPERYTEAFYPEGDIREVVVLGDAGDVVVETGARLRVERTIHGAERALSLSHSVESGALVLESRCDGLLPCSVDVRVEVEESVPVFVVLDNGDVLIRDINHAEVELSKGSVRIEEAGDLKIRLGQGDVHGSVKDGGMIDVVVAEGDVEMEIPAGPWKADIEADLETLVGLDAQEESERDLSVVAHGGEVTLRSSTPFASR
jgi:hypothetical protein